MSVPLLIDENLPATLAARLSDQAVHSSALGRQPSDDLLWDFARRENRVILTKDADFFAKLALYGAPPKVVWVRTGNLRRADLEMLIVNAWPRIVALLETADLVEVHRDRLEAIKF